MHVGIHVTEESAFLIPSNQGSDFDAIASFFLNAGHYANVFQVLQKLFQCIFCIFRGFLTFKGIFKRFIVRF